jgi:hypothetical protein
MGVVCTPAHRHVQTQQANSQSMCSGACLQVYMRKLDPRARLAPRDDANVSTWNPTTFSLQVRLGN